MESENQNPVQEAPAISKPLFYKKELIVILPLIALVSVALGALSLLYKGPAAMITLMSSSTGTLQMDKNLVPFILGFALVDTLIIVLVYLFCHLLGEEKPNLVSVRSWIIFTILFILGLAAYGLIVIGMQSFQTSLFLSFFLASFIYGLYIWLMAKLYFFDYVKDKRIFYEVVRFSLVGAIAAVFDLSVCALFEFKILPQSWPSVALTIVSVTMGFIVGVTVNYLCSVYMVFKATTNKDISKTNKGRIIFVALSAVGLLIGYGLQYMFYDWLKLGYILVFIIRTIVVLFWNYLSRKYIIFR